MGILTEILKNYKLSSPVTLHTFQVLGSPTWPVGTMLDNTSVLQKVPKAVLLLSVHQCEFRPSSSSSWQLSAALCSGQVLVSSPGRLLCSSSPYLSKLPHPQPLTAGSPQRSPHLLFPPSEPSSLPLHNSSNHFEKRLKLM